MMKKLSALLFVLVCFSIFSVHAQSKAEQQVAAAVEALRKSMVEPDSLMLDKLIHAELTYGHSGGKVEGKASLIHNLVSGNSDFLTVEISNQTIQVRKNIAIVRHILNADTHDRGKEPTHVKLAILYVWEKHHGQWQMLARQAVKS